MALLKLCNICLIVGFNVKGHKSVEYRGDRDRYEIVEFARRMDGPPVRYFGNCDQFKEVIENKKVFFVYLDDSRLQETHLRDNYTRAAEEFLAVMNFYSTSIECMADRLRSANAMTNKNDFLFGWLGHPEIANSIAMETLPIPSLIVLNTSSYQFYLPKLEEGEKVPSPQSILELLDQVKNHTAKGMWKGNPVLTTVLLGLPFGLFSIICYTSCCTDILAANEEDEEAELAEAAARHQKRE
ncbi:Protein disulfide-isomerase TMX3 like protein [Argiope bruennichi]|uniref:Protein disulfide-isomerase TMX3 like protein n=1 Tax=Argiope bruennichi TaxID=94029 RepID=A0A8T0F5W0_ARGBR|nr:Protein disulfide-isomerase TMX3 like protein [Argiope bruennichi]